jgi:hypothetical protein
MNYISIIVVVLFGLNACVTPGPNQLTDTNISNRPDITENTDPYGQFLSIDGLNTIGFVFSPEGLYFSYGDIGEDVVQCKNYQYKLCLIAPGAGLAFVIPTLPVNEQSEWEVDDYKFDVVLSFDSVILVDVRNRKNKDHEVLRFVYDGNAVRGYSWGGYSKDKSCPSCFVSRISYIWTGDDVIWKRVVEPITGL